MKAERRSHASRGISSGTIKWQLHVDRKDRQRFQSVAAEYEAK